MKTKSIAAINDLGGFDAECIESLKNAAFINDDVYELLRVISSCFTISDGKVCFCGDRFDVRVLENAVHSFSLSAAAQSVEK